MDLSHLVIGLHLATAHAGGAIPAQAMETVTPGVYVKAPSGWAGGVYRNSFKRPSLWAGFMFETPDKRWALTLGAATGYDRQEGATFCRPGRVHVASQPCYEGDKAPVRAMVAPSVRLPIPNSRTAARFTYLPRVGKGAHALHFSMEF